MRYKVWRSNKDKSLHLLCGEGSGAFNALSVAFGIWASGREVQRVMSTDFVWPIV